MKIYQLIDHYPSEAENPFVSSLMDGVCQLSNDIEWYYGWDFFWSERIFTCDIIHTHWFGFWLLKTYPGYYEKLKERLVLYKRGGGKIFATCHNLMPHVCDDDNEQKLYSWVYSHADVVIHLGQYSLDFLKMTYPQAQHVLIPHHVYDKLCPQIVSKEASFRKLRLSKSRRYVLCFGAFRSKEERKMVDSCAKRFRKEGIDFIAPHYHFVIRNGNSAIKKIIKWLSCRINEITHPNIHIYGWEIGNDTLPFFFGAADVVLIQRFKTLNSGNLPLAFYMGKVVVGPDVGNVGEQLRKHGNPVFSPADINSLFTAVNEGLRLSSEGKGAENKQYADTHLSTKQISEQLLQLYRQIINDPKEIEQIQ